MQWRLVVAVVVVTGAAVADPVPDERLFEKIQSANAATRAEGARQLAKRAAAGQEHAIELAQEAAISNDPKVRGPLLDALIAAKKIDKATAALVPTASVLEKKIRQLLRKDSAENLPVAKDCRITGGTAKGATLECNARRCDRCDAIRRSFRVTTGVRWTIDKDQSSRRDDGSCGHCMSEF
ncbi:MAG: hypothetical protein H0T46_23370 [Deltaproteobacteria bacterium]|nr:hypothetical protein [Deltaproteobacteria bacterium]